MDLSHAATLDDSYPGFTFQASCHNSFPEVTDNLSYSLLQNGCIGTIGATRVSWYYPGQTYFIGSTSNAGMTYEYAKRLIENEMDSGHALYEMKQVLNRGIWMNFTVFNIYGDPSTGLFTFTEFKGLQNGDFEQGVADTVFYWTPDVWKPAESIMVWEPFGEGYQGSRSVSIEHTEENDSRWIQAVSGLLPGMEYRLSGWIKGQDIVNVTGGIGANLCLFGTWEHTPGISGTFNWTKVSMTFIAPENGIAVIGCRLGYWGNTTTGKAWFDNISLKSLELECVLDSRFKETSITVGKHYYADRSYTITGGVPSWMVGRTLIKTPNDERFNNAASGYLRFTTPVSWWVYVLFDSRASSLPDWLNGWEHRSQYKIYTSLKPQPYLEVWRKYFNAGQCVNLGGNFGPGSSDENRSNFVVVYGKGCVLDPKFEETSITVGERYYADRSYTITGGVPSWMVDRTLIQTPNDERFNNAASGYLRFTTPVSWWVYVLFDSRASSKPDWLNGWEHRSQYKIYTSLKPQPYLEVWRKYFNAGQCVNLGGNFGPGSSDENRSNFVVVYDK
jgi:hypothetical protein